MRSWADCLRLSEPVDSVLDIGPRVLLRLELGDEAGGTAAEDDEVRAAIVHIYLVVQEGWHQCGLK